MEIKLFKMLFEKLYAETLIIQKAQFAKFETSECVYNLYQLT